MPRRAKQQKSRTQCLRLRCVTMREERSAGGALRTGSAVLASRVVMAMLLHAHLSLTPATVRATGQGWRPPRPAEEEEEETPQGEGARTAEEPSLQPRLGLALHGAEASRCSTRLVLLIIMALLSVESKEPKQKMPAQLRPLMMLLFSTVHADR